MKWSNDMSNDIKTFVDANRTVTEAVEESRINVYRINYNRSSFLLSSCFAEIVHCFTSESLNLIK